MAWLFVAVAFADVAPGCRCDGSAAPLLLSATAAAALGLLGMSRRG